MTDQTEIIQVEPEKQVASRLQSLEVVADLLDNRFRIPYTNIRFGLDAIIGLIPYVGDIAGFVVALFLMIQMFRYGASPVLMVRIFGNYLVDAVVGAVPFLGDLFDIGFKANRRNVNMLKEYYADGDPKPHAGLSLFVLFVFLLAILFGFLWLSYKVLEFTFQSMIGF